MGVIEYPEDPAVTAIREALGAVAVGEPATYWLYADAAGDWCVRREGSSQPQRFETREQALAFARLAVVRCASYCLHLQGTDGRIARRFFLGSSANPYAETMSRMAPQTHMRL
jgi:Uncharacterized protein conserved in bacteria (DUF2188)